ncbi:Zn-dependent hydrolase [Evansella sp. AB-rgal1]|uniref:Zn-dependent hydrolase n=1 Tax=Evansella sp. AB-rgal1 TaxID=3242696 RepID=UPI00359E92EB
MEQFSEQLYKKLMKDYDSINSHSGINGERLAKRLASIANIGLTSELGSHRIGFSTEEKAAKYLVKEWMAEAGLTISEDGAGNVFGRMQGSEQNAPVILSGSHLDSVPNGGHFDGPLGVLAALEVVEAWNETGFIPRKSYEVVIFTDEEGARFHSGMLGSSAMMRKNQREELLNRKDIDGIEFEEVLHQYGLRIDNFFDTRRSLNEIEAFVEVHIEQGKRLEKEDVSVGVVTGIAGPCWLEITFQGEAGHAGNTPMNDRKDALVAASLFISQLESLPKEVSDSSVATVGRMQVHPNGVNVIPGSVTLTVDIRDIHLQRRDDLVDEIISLAKRISDKRSIGVTFEEKVRITPVPITEDMQIKAISAVESIGERVYTLPSGAGHDAMIVGTSIPVAMLFTRSKDGISHNPKEWSSLHDCVITIHALKVLLESLVK